MIMFIMGRHMCTKLRHHRCGGHNLRDVRHEALAVSARRWDEAGHSLLPSLLYMVHRWLGLRVCLDRFLDCKKSHTLPALYAANARILLS